VSKGYINSAFSLKEDCIFWDGEIESMLAPTKLPAQLDAMYKKLVKDYPKYYRMDGMAKLVFILGDLLCERTGICEKYAGEDIAIALFNSSGSYPSDLIHSEAIKEGFAGASPSNFVYTLPNVGVGELCIKRKITGETIFLIEDNFSEDRMSELAELYIGQKKCKAIIIGWVEPTQSEGNHLLLISEEESGLALPNTAENIKNLC